MYQIQKIRTHIDYVEEDPAMYYLLVDDSVQEYILVILAKIAL